MNIFDRLFRRHKRTPIEALCEKIYKNPDDMKNWAKLMEMTHEAVSASTLIIRAETQPSVTMH